MTHQPDIPRTMRAITLPDHGGPDVLIPDTVATPQPRPGEILIKVACAGVNGPDIAQRQGNYAPPPDASPLPGLEVSGIVVARGPDTGRYRIGDAVVALCNGGGYAEFVAAPEGQVLPKPDNWTWQQAAALPETFFTIQQTLVERGGLSHGKTVLIHGGAGGIGATAIQMTRLFGAVAIATTSSTEKAAYAKAQGAHFTIDYPTEDFVARTREITDGRGADIIVDIVGGTYAARNLAACARGGHILQLAVREGARAELNLGLVLMKALTLSGSTLRPLSSEAKAGLAAALEATVWPAIADKRIIAPRIRAFPLEKAAQAHRAMEAHEHFGKIVLVTDFDQDRMSS